MIACTVHDRVMTSHDPCTCRNSRVLTIASLQGLKMEALIPVPTEVWSMINFLNAQSIVPIKIHHQLCEVYGHTRLDGQLVSCRSSAGRCLIIIHPIAWTSCPVIAIFSYTSRNFCPDSISVFKITEWQRWVSQSFQSQVADFYDIRYKSWSQNMTNVLILKVNMLKNSSTFAVSVPINIYIKLVSVSGHRET